jgi:hypothetical protein
MSKSIKRKEHIMAITDASKKRSRYTLRTSDRRVFRRCLRKWDYLSSMRQNLTRSGAEQNINFWFGSAIHFALEDYHSWNHYGDPRKAFYAYYKAFKESELPIGADYCYELGMAMLSYYLTWYPRYNSATGFETVWLDEEGNDVPPHSPGAYPAVEQRFMLPLNVSAIVDIETDVTYAQYQPESDGYYGGRGTLISVEKGEHKFSEDGYAEQDEMEHIWLKPNGEKRPVQIIPLFYHGTMDRIVKDKFGRWWILDYKTAKGADTNKLDTDDQISAYIWAATVMFKKPIYGFIYLQLTKDSVQEPRRLKNGDLSVDKKQKTTYSLLKQEIINDYGSVSNAPNKIIQFLNELASRETPEGDRFIRWDFVRRSNEQIINTAKAVYAELALMMSPDLECFPNPTRDCIWDCPVREACIAQDREDSDTLELFFKDWEERPRNEDGNTDPWREDLPSPEEVSKIPLEEILDMAKCMTIELDSNADESGFKFLYDDDDIERS